MKFAYEDLSYEQFETLVVLLNQKLLGSGVQGFSEGPDGGRDARFEGTANLIPSEAKPWNGTVIIQAKHTSSFNKHFGESDFISHDGKSSIVAKEATKVARLRKSGQLDHYTLFANRRLTAQAQDDIMQFLSDKCDLPTESLYLCGTNNLELWFKIYPDVPKIADLSPIDSPLIVSPDELALIVEALARQRETIANSVDHPPVLRTSLSDKNELNKMSLEYEAELTKRFLKFTPEIQCFLADPQNDHYLELYESVVDEFQFNIIAKRRDYQTFDNVLTYVLELLVGRDPILSKNRRLTRAMLYYMYWNCDIGRNKGAEAIQA